MAYADYIQSYLTMPEWKAGGRHTKTGKMSPVRSNVPKPALDGVLNMEDFNRQMAKMNQAKIGPSRTTGGSFGFVQAGGDGPAMIDPQTGRHTGLVAPGGGGSSGGGGGGMHIGTSRTGSASSSGSSRQGRGATGIRAKAAAMARGSMPAGRIVSMKTIGGSSGLGGKGSSRKQSQLAEDLIAQLTQMQGQANKAGKARYQQLLQQIAQLQQGILGEGGTLAQAEERMAGFGEAGRARLDQDLIRQMAEAEQGLISRGLGNTTVRTSARRGVAEDIERARQALDERVAAQQAGLLERRAGMQADLGRLEADAILSRQDEGPNMGTYLNLIQALTSV